MSVRIRPAEPTDLPQIHAIQVHYVEHTVMNFSYVPASLEEMRSTYDDVRREGFPYLVVTLGDEVLGYAYVHSFRARAAYQHTAELSIFVRPQNVRQGMGESLMHSILRELREAKKEQGGAGGAERTLPGHNIHQLLAIMTVDPDDKQAMRLLSFYERRGFKQVGRLEEIGWKNGMWLDTRYMQLAL